MKSIDRIKLIAQIIGSIIIFCFIFAGCVIKVASIIGIESDYCIEDGDCGEGREILYEGNVVIINQGSCLEHHWIWNENRKECKVRY